MTTTAITILGLGPGSIQDLTIEAHARLAQAAQEQQTVHFRTLIHPTVAPLQQALPALPVDSFDRLYEESADWTTLYQQIATTLCDLAEGQPVLYAVPGHPLIGESSVQLLLKMARERGLSTRIVAGLSFLEPTCSLLELDPFDHGLQLVDATMLASLQADEVAGKITPTSPLLVAQLYNRRLASEVKLLLGECYPDEWPVQLVRAAGVQDEETVIELPLYELDRHNHANHLSTLYVPPLDALTALRVPETLRYITMRLRREPDGCPWDRKQTHQSLARYALEEAYEVVEALEAGDSEALADELGDLLLQVYLHAEIARQDGEFAIGDVFEHVNAKLIRRHPHVFGETQVEGAGQVVQNWEAIKQQERKAAGKDVSVESIIKELPAATPALMGAQDTIKRVVGVGFAFSAIEEVYGKINEELLEIQQANTPEERLEELGDLLFMAVELAQFIKVDAEQALRYANRKFRRRFHSMEAIAREQQRALTSYSLDEWQELWQQAKQIEAAGRPDMEHML